MYLDGVGSLRVDLDAVVHGLFRQTSLWRVYLPVQPLLFASKYGVIDGP